MNEQNAKQEPRTCDLCGSTGLIKTWGGFVTCYCGQTITPASAPADAPTTNASIPLADATGEAGDGPTPETDEAELDYPTGPRFVVKSDFARKLERRIADLTAELAEARKAIEAAPHDYECAKARRYRLGGEGFETKCDCWKSKTK